MVFVNGGRGKVVDRIEPGMETVNVFMVDEGRTTKEAIKKLRPLATDMIR